MSIAALNDAKRLRVGDFGAKFLLILLADRHNSDTGQCSPSLTLLIQESEMSPATVMRKLDKLEQAGFLKRQSVRTEAGTRETTQYDLMFTDKREEAPKADAEGAQVQKKREKSARKSLPPHDWKPSPATIEQLQKEFPHHDVQGEIEHITREWIDYCHGSDHKYARFDAALANSARRFFRRQSARPAALGGRAGGSQQSTSGVAGAVRRLHSGHG